MGEELVRVEALGLVTMEQLKEELLRNAIAGVAGLELGENWWKYLHKYRRYWSRTIKWAV